MAARGLGWCRGWGWGPYSGICRPRGGETQAAASALTLWDRGGGVQPVCASAALCRCGYSDCPALIPLSPQGTGSETDGLGVKSWLALKGMCVWSWASEWPSRGLSFLRCDVGMRRKGDNPQSLAADSNPLPAPYPPEAGTPFPTPSPQRDHRFPSLSPQLKGERFQGLVNPRRSWSGSSPQGPPLLTQLPPITPDPKGWSQQPHECSCRYSCFH